MHLVTLHHWRYYSEIKADNKGKVLKAIINSSVSDTGALLTLYCNVKINIKGTLFRDEHVFVLVGVCAPVKHASMTPK